jgi:DNA-binding response OmpR family regulator
MIKKRILLVEDDPNLGMVLQEYLQLKGGFEIVLCKDGEEGLKQFYREPFDLCIFDVMMPKKDGFTLGREIRSVNQDIPIIYATAKSMMEDKTEGFNLGADDYITKPFRIEELLLRIHSILRRTSGLSDKKEDQSVFQVGRYLFDYPQQLIIDGDKIQRLSGKEAELMLMLCQRQNDVLKREEVLLKIWNDDTYFNGRSMDVYLTKIRKYLKDDPQVEIINIHGKGYKLLVR